MPLLIAIAGFLGAWLLVAGPVFQAAVELSAEEVDRDGFHAADQSVPAQRRMSPWWWLLPPVAVARQRRERRKHREALLRVLTAEQIDQLLRFGAKATGWLLVGSGGALIAVKETWELVERLEWPVGAFWGLVAGALALSLLYTVVRRRQDDRMLAGKRAMTAEVAPVPFLENGRSQPSGAAGFEH